jgi:undecaprenyl diphosphate synthase
LLWQSAYAELLFVDTLWPDFSGKEFTGALEQFAQRDRRFGAVASDAVA